VCAAGLEHVLHQEGHHLIQLNGLFLAIGEAGDFLALDQELAVGAAHMAEDTRRVADGANDLVLPDGLFNQGNSGGVLGQIPERAVAAGQEDGVVIIGVDIGQLFCVRECRFAFSVRLESFGAVGSGIRRGTIGVNWRLAPFGRGQRDLGAGVFEDVIGAGELFQPETGLVTGVAHFAV
jgi:hypothetical protein